MHVSCPHQGFYLCVCGWGGGGGGGGRNRVCFPPKPCFLPKSNVPPPPPPKKMIPKNYRSAETMNVILCVIIIQLNMQCSFFFSLFQVSNKSEVILTFNGNFHRMACGYPIIYFSAWFLYVILMLNKCIVKFSHTSNKRNSSIKIE